MKNALLALALFAYVGTASATEGEKGGKKTKKACTTEMQAKCSKEMAASGASCCVKKDAKTTTASVKPAPAAKPVTKSL
ncbi:hypothetical protein [Hymenobacter sp. DG25A]|uniref:hypothetical protein n=1 Tax=Hymenobacter sp. DG25A TaxID=1385663 RepID=UPI0006BD4FB9|nr:hypothetical protein [Hymenobacter sp. DG25A]ALD20845.1 hypothetical protein AM218_05920 [Hymenobacter sp. DG25A]